MERHESPTSSTESGAMGAAYNSFASPHSIPNMPSLSPMVANNVMAAQASRSTLSARGVSQPSASGSSHGASVAYYQRSSSSMVAISTNNPYTEWPLVKPVSYRELIYPLERGPGHYRLSHVGPSVLSPGYKVTPYQCRGCQMPISVTVVFGDRETRRYYSNCDPNVGRDLGNGKQHSASCVFTTPIKERRTYAIRGTGPERQAKKDASDRLDFKRARQRHHYGSSKSFKESSHPSTSKDCVPHGNQSSKMNTNQGGFRVDPMATIFVSTTHTVRSFRSSEDHLAFEKYQKSLE